MDEKVYTPEVTQDTPFPNDPTQLTGLPSGTPAAGTYNPTVSKDKPFLTRKVAYELLSSALNTRSKKVLQEFDLVQQGGFQVGKYEEGVSGDLRITPNGITARDMAGLITFVLDALTGDAIFRGEVQGGSFISGLVVVGDNSVIIDGESKRMVFYDDDGTPVIVIGNA